MDFETREKICHLEDLLDEYENAAVEGKENLVIDLRFKIDAVLAELEEELKK